MLASGLQGNRNDAKRAGNPSNREPSAFDVLPSHDLKRLSTRDPLSPPQPEFDRDKVLVCMALAFCLAGASTSIVYRLLG
jgi:hypothetical protein